ncbi:MULTISPECIES: SDR family NAD(P)-dependent oxidoreductase [unclassified Polaromonas]|uniref:SDR family NAD(P)-dependent oxidoreductase n=1 Tax=unclassified Polaromonas TaxID=2638319 RepID=UPI0018C8DEB1|nr:MULTISPECIES: SDR family NAD(P)-dependent oxidoreductase [unclassified Polaromonas]MBG6070757.1 NAD(P)-dependent dehydrogenase (short-subunit alcohol dehydrogenase family) [Polaromonas sp. CG_9.7]MBG6112934.1 NAD(P)-dependent dehydrogenase (short-subunit alcohol dehydrogenase family) [Polaromonas sp. CG_9.2]MDH6186408.1 NAD(P)-dependent dehydrogenase (short-subunit alcohol dehydrogenase family) [Polaromonas sp. CG_23.6]
MTAAENHDSTLFPAAGTGESSIGAALVIGAAGGLGAALVANLSGTAGGPQPCPAVLALSRSSLPAIDYGDEASLKMAADWVAAQCALQQVELRLLVVASGFLHGPQGQPERSFSQLDAGYLAHVFQVNTIGPALVMKHFLPLLPKQGRCVAAFLSAKVGSISDNALGGWYGYRASKAALNQLVKTASIEMTRRNRQSVCVALHPGTVDTALSQPFAKTGLKVRPAEEAAGDLLSVLNGVTPAETGNMLDYQGLMLPF